MSIGQNISIVIPIWNEEGNIQPLIDGIDQVMKAKKIIYETIVVDDHSTDQTAKVAKSTGETVIETSINTGSKAGAQNYEPTNRNGIQGPVSG